MRRGGAPGDGVVLNRKCRNSRASISDRRRRPETAAVAALSERQENATVGDRRYRVDL
jgi:hypothetical protein